MDYNNEEEYLTGKEAFRAVLDGILIGLAITALVAAIIIYPSI